MRSGVVLLIALGVASLGAGALRGEGTNAHARPIVVIDPGHGGADYGARGSDGSLEKRRALEVAKKLGAGLMGAGYRVVYTRERDEFVSLVERADIANRAGGDLFLSIHANASPDATAAGFETYFLSSDASDDDARRLAEAENSVLDPSGVLPGSESVVGDILGDLLWTAHLESSSRLAAAIQRRLARLPGPSRGVKQAPFMVLMGVNMPAALVEIGFLTHPNEARRLGEKQHQGAIALAVVGGLEAYSEQELGEDR